jgi:hypothetical protein
MRALKCTNPADDEQADLTIRTENGKSCRVTMNGNKTVVDGDVEACIAAKQIIT